MPVTELPLLDAFKHRLNWLDRRQVVIAQNIANADTPGFRPSDLSPKSFRTALARPQAVPLQATQPSHIAGGRVIEGRERAQLSAEVYEVAPAGNAVVLEEQMAKMSETAIDHRLVNQLYRKCLGMLRLAASGRG